MKIKLNTLSEMPIGVDSYGEKVSIMLKLRTVELTVTAEHSLADGLDGEKTGKRISVTGEEGTLLFLLRSQNNAFVEGAVFPTIIESGNLEIGVSIPTCENTEIVTTSKGLFITDGVIRQRLSNVYPDPYGEGVAVVWRETSTETIRLT